MKGTQSRYAHTDTDGHRVTLSNTDILLCKTVKYPSVT